MKNNVVALIMVVAILCFCSIAVTAAEDEGTSNVTIAFDNAPTGYDFQLVQVPNIQFGQKSLGSSPYFSINISPALQVRDYTATNNDWIVTASLNAFTADNGSPDVTSAQLTLPVGTITTLSGTSTNLSGGVLDVISDGQDAQTVLIGGGANGLFQESWAQGAATLTDSLGVFRPNTSYTAIMDWVLTSE